MAEEDFSGLLRAYRKQRRLTQAQFASRIGVTLRALAYWEAGSHFPGNQELEGIANALQLTPEERQALMALLPTSKAGKLVRAMPAWSDITAPPGIGDLIRALRWRKRLSREQAARALGVHRTTLTHWEEGRAAPNEETRLRLCAALDALPPERAVLLVSPNLAPLWDVGEPRLDACREQTARLECDSMGQMDPLFDLRAHLLAGTLWNLAAHQPRARPLLAQTYAAHAAFCCLRGDDLAARDYSHRSLHLIQQGYAPPEAAWYRALWAGGHSLAHSKPKSGPEQNFQQVTRWLARARTPDTRAALLLSAAWWASQAGFVGEARNYWQQTRALMDTIPHLNRHFPDSVQSVYADILVKEGRYNEGMQVNAHIVSDLYPRQVERLIFQTSVFLKAGDKNEADSSLRRAYSLIAAYQVDLYRKQADQFAAQLERLA